MQKICLTVQPTKRKQCKTTCIKDTLIENGYDIPDDDEGEIVFLVNKNDYEVYILKYKQRTACSSASAKQFSHVEMTDKCINGTSLSYPFFTLKQGLEPGHDHTYFSPSETKRVNALMNSLTKSNFTIQFVDDCSYCPFSGGGDLYIKTDVSKPSLIFLGGTEDPNGECLTVDANISPTSRGTQKLASFSVEAKNAHVKLDEKKYQLWANMTVLCVDQFVDCCKNHYSKQDVIGVQILTGYGALLCGNGGLAAYKLEIEFNGDICFVTKVEPDHYNVVKAARLVDLLIEQFMEKVDKWQTH